MGTFGSEQTRSTGGLGLGQGYPVQARLTKRETDCVLEAFHRTLTAMTTKTERLDLRLTRDQRDLLESASAVYGSTLAGYAVTHLMEAATHTLTQARAMTLPPDEWVAFLTALDAPDDDAWRALRAHKPVWET
jgi:uncharacterized protein (DUF1778 family)